MTTRSQLLPADRLQMIADLVSERGSVRGSDLVEMLGVTDETIRRDLLRLSEMGIVRAVPWRRGRGPDAGRGGNRAATPGACLREAGHRQACRRAGADGSSVILDSGTTTLALARALRGRRNLIVVTTAVTNAVELVGNPATTVVMTGGVIRPQTFGASGELTAATLREIHVDQAFLATHSVSVEGRPDLPQLRGGGSEAGDDRGRHRGHPARGSLQVRTRVAGPYRKHRCRAQDHHHARAWTRRRPTRSGTWASSSSSAEPLGTGDVDDTPVES